MAISQMVHTLEIGNKIISVIKTALETSEGLKVIQFGGLDYLPAPTTIVSYVPAVLVKPDPKVTFNFKELAKSYRAVYQFRVVYVGKYSTTDKVVENKATKSRSVSELFLNDLTLGALALGGNSSIEFVALDEIEFQPPEDDFVWALKENLYAFAVNLSVYVLTEA